MTSDFSLLNVTSNLLGIDNDTDADNGEHLPLSCEAALFPGVLPNTELPK